MSKSKEDEKASSSLTNRRSLLIGAGFVTTLGLGALVAGAAWSSASATRDQNQVTMEEEEDAIAQAGRSAANSAAFKLENVEKTDVKLLLDGRRLAVRALGYGSLLAVALVGSASLLVWVGFGAPRSFDEFRQRAGNNLPKLTKDEHAEKLDFKNLRELSDYLERQK